MLKIITFAISSILGLIYLGYMAREDIKGNRTVPVLPSYIALVTGFFVYGCGCVIGHIPFEWKMILGTIIFLLVMWLTKVIGSGDAKALGVLTLFSIFSYHKGYGAVHRLDLMIPCGTYLIAAIASLPFSFKQSRKAGKTIKEILRGKGERIAFFPFLFIGYAAIVLIQIIYNF